VVLPHGGPHARDTPGFDWWAQALASRGYAVLQVNYRGSSGLGADFFAAGFGEFGRKMQTDLSDGVRHLVQDGLVDPKRVCIVGGSYGGYAALAGATLDRGVYRCAVSYAGVSDLRSDLKDSISKEGESAGRFWLRYVGAKNIDDPLLDQRSPAAHAGDVDIPILLIHGRDDTIVTISQSRRMADALRKAGKPVELIELSSEDHWLSRGETRLQMLKATVAFLEKNNPPD
jgi:dipeptidyl aminopeptidase/acylaminoacyl peptidase